MSEGKQSRSLLGITAFLILAFGIAWISWVWMPDARHTSRLLFSLYALPGAFAPAIATFIVRAWITREGFGDAGLGLHLGKWRYYLIAWFLPFPVIAFVVLGVYLLGLGTPDIWLAHLGLRIDIPRAFVPYITPFIFLFTAFITTPILFGEEFGWRGYLQVRLFASRPTFAAIATGIIWGLWHWPIIARGYEFPGNPMMALATFCVGTVLIAIIFGWLREKSGSVWVTSLAHAATNGIGGALSTLWYPDRAHYYVTSYLGYLAWIPLGLLCVWIIAQRQRA